MPNTRDIKRRIGSIENTRQITRAMELVSVTKMRRSQDAVLASRDYADKARELFTAVSNAEEIQDQPLLAPSQFKKPGVVLMTSDRGLCGSMNANVLRHVLRSRERNLSGGRFITIGKKGEQALRRTGSEIVASFSGLADQPHYIDIRPVATVVIEEFLAGRIDHVLLAYPKFISTLTNEPRLDQLLPAEPEEAPQEKSGLKPLTLFEPSPEAVLESLVPRLVEIQLWQALLETKASEHSARMMAMRNATNNASDLIDELKFSYNQARQAAITTEIAEIAAAAAV